MRRSKADALKTRDHILDAALDVFHRKGIANSSIAEIADIAGCTRGAVYWHFKNRLSIFEALYERYYQPIVETILRDADSDHPQPLLQLKALCINFLNDFSEDARLRKTMHLFMKSDFSGELAPFKAHYQDRKNHSRELLENYFSKAQQMGVLDKNICPAVLSLALSFYIKGILHELLDDPKLVDLKQQSENLISIFLNLELVHGAKRLQTECS